MQHRADTRESFSSDRSTATKRKRPESRQNLPLSSKGSSHAIESRSLCVAQRCGLAAAIGILFAGSTAQAQTTIWNNNGPDWNTAANWNNGIPNNSSYIAQFNSGSYTYSPSVSSPTTVGAIWVTGGGAVSISGAAMTVNGATVDTYPAAGIVLDNAAATLTINNQISFGGLDGSNNPLGILQVHQGTVQVNSGGLLTNTNEIDVGDTAGQTGTLNLSGGTVNVLLGGQTYNPNYWSNGVYVGSQGGIGNVTMSGNAVLDAG